MNLPTEPVDQRVLIDGGNLGVCRLYAWVFFVCVLLDLDSRMFELACPHIAFLFAHAHFLQVTAYFLAPHSSIHSLTHCRTTRVQGAHPGIPKLCENSASLVYLVHGLTLVSSWHHFGSSCVCTGHHSAACQRGTCARNKIEVYHQQLGL